METRASLSEKKPFDITQLPLRPKEAARPQGERRISLVSNLHKVNINLKTSVYCYHLDFFPHIEADNRTQKRRIIIEAGDIIIARIGKFGNSGQNLYGITPPMFEKGMEQPKDFKAKEVKKPQPQVWVKLQKGGIFIRIRLCKTITLQDFKNQQGRFSNSLQFLNKLLNTLLLPLGLKEAGKSGVVVDNSTRQFLPSGLYLYNGFITSFEYLQAGLFLKVDTCTKIVRSKTVLECINQLYHANSYLDKMERRDKVKEELMGKIVMANYGNNKHWKVEDIIFDQEASQRKIELGEGEITLVEYFKSKYNLQVKTLKQPLLKSRMSRHDKRECFLIPEFLLMTGMPENDQRLRREVSQITIRPPDEKLKKINGLMQKLGKSDAQFSLSTLRDKLGMQIQTTSYKVDGLVLNNPRLALGRGKQVDRNKTSNFNFRSMPIFNSSKPVNLTFVSFSQVDIATVQKCMEKLAAQMSINLNIKLKKMGEFKSSQSVEDLKQLIHKHINSDEESFLLIALPNPLKTFYKQIKKWSLAGDNPFLTQIVLEATLKKKGLDSILTKILLQIAAKAGNTLWVSESCVKVSKKTMIIGVHQTGKTGNKIVTAFTATTNDNFQEYFSHSFVTSKGISCIIDKMQDVIGLALKAYLSKNKEYPEDIIILRNGCTDNQEKMVLEHEVQGVISFMKMKQCPSKLTYISIDAKPNHKFFEKKEGKFQNPPCGTIINQDVVSEGYDFYLYPAQCNMGAATPVRYKVLFNNSSIPESLLQSLMYSQCFNYANWTGSIRFPSSLQYSKKLSQFVAQQIDDPLTSQKLGKNLYFI